MHYAHEIDENTYQLLTLLAQYQYCVRSIAFLHVNTAFWWQKNIVSNFNI